MLSLGIRYLRSYVTAADPVRREQVEWPPHPARLFMALAAAHFETGADPGERRALEWLEALGEDDAPHIVAGDADARSNPDRYVPVNDRDGLDATAALQDLPLARKRQPRQFSTAWLARDTVYFVWPRAQLADGVRQALAALCSKVTRMGHSTSLVQAWISEDSPEENPDWVPDDENAEVFLRIVPPGTLEYLESQFNRKAVSRYAELVVAREDRRDRKRFQAIGKALKEEFPHGPPARMRPQLSIHQGYARAESNTAPAAPHGAFSPHLVVMRLARESGARHTLDLAATLVLAGRWREALISRCDDAPAAIRSLISGHDDTGLPLAATHLAFAPLPFVGHQNADGHLLGMALVLPATLEAGDRLGALQALARVTHLKLGPLGVWNVEVVRENRPPTALRATTWTAHADGATEWATVTPIAFDRHPNTRRADRRRRQEIVEMIARACERTGHPRPSNVILTDVSAHLGAPPAHTFPALKRKDGGTRQHTHAIVVFDQPVRGPLLLGAGRFRGYGLCRPLTLDTKEERR